jgi:CubicO group peptidase (beta-lactamase class C family)
VSETTRGVSPAVQGHVSQGFEAVREAFVENFTRRKESGAACCIYYRGEKVVDLWGGVRNRATGEPWEENTMVIVHSTTKGMVGLALALAHSRGWLDYEELVCTYWPEFAQQGKGKVTVRQLLSHQAGLIALDAYVDRSIVSDLDRLAVVLAQQKPAWEPGTRQAYPSIIFGFYASELLRRVDPQRRSLGQFFQDEIASPLGLDFYIRLPKEIPNSRLATYQNFNPAMMLFGINPSMPIRFMLALFNPRSLVHRAVFKNPGVGIPFDQERIYSREIEQPSHGGVGTARAIARAYSVFAGGGRELGLSAETLEQLMAPAVPPLRGFYDEFLKFEAPFSLGFQKPCPLFPYSQPGAFGHPGSGGSFGWADPKSAVGYAYVTNRAGFYQGNDPRDLALRSAFHRALGEPRAADGVP